MALVVILILASVLGFIYGMKKKSKVIASIFFILCIAVIAIGVYFYNHPY